MHGALYRRYPAARRKGAVFDQRALDLLCAGDCGLDRGPLPLPAVAADHYREHRPALAGGLGRGGAQSMAMQENSRSNLSAVPASTVDPGEVAKFSKLSDEWWDPNGKMAPLHKINPLRLTYIRDAACRKFERNVKSLNCLSGLRILDIGCGAGLLCEPFTRLGAQVIGVDPSATNIAAARLHADKGHLSIDYRCTTVEQMDVRERFDIVLAMEVVEHVTDVGMFLNRCAAMLKPGGLMVISTLNRNWKSFALHT